MLILRKDLGSPQCLKIKGVLHAGPGASFETSSAATLVALGSSFFSLAIELELDSVADTEVDGESSKGRGEVAAGRAAPARHEGAAAARACAAALGLGRLRHGLGVGIEGASLQVCGHDLDVERLRGPPHRHADRLTNFRVVHRREHGRDLSLIHI